ncbi:MAG: dUTP diphosphatase [Candidatus Paceibacterota bacterium]
MNLRIKKLHSDAIIPSYAHEGDAGMDLFSLEKVVIEPNTQVSLATGIALEIPEGYVGLIWDKSGLSHKHRLKTFGGVVDAGYRGEVRIGIMNLSDTSYVFEKGHKIAQMLIQPVVSATITESDNLSDSSRGEGGFGSTGK